MQTTEVITTCICDVCKKPFNPFQLADRMTTAVRCLTVEVYYGGTYQCKDICFDCSYYLTAAFKEILKP